MGVNPILYGGLASCCSCVPSLLRRYAVPVAGAFSFFQNESPVEVPILGGVGGCSLFQGSDSQIERHKKESLCRIPSFLTGYTVLSSPILSCP